jgi:Transposase DDE domain
VQVLAPVPEAKIVEERLGKREFHIDPQAGTVTCPAGQRVQVSTSKNGFRGANFSRKVCGACPLKDRCCPGRARRQINLGEHEDLLLAARQALADPATAEHLRRDRPRIELLLGLLAHRYSARKSRYIGSAKARLQAAWAAALVNLNPIGHRLALHGA